MRHKPRSNNFLSLKPILEQLIFILRGVYLRFDLDRFGVASSCCPTGKIPWEMSHFSVQNTKKIQNT